MSKLLETITGEKPILVHSELVNSENKIASFRNSKKDWIVSVAMISEGVDIKRLRVLLYLPNSQTELSFRQAMGRIVRTMGPDDDSISHVVLPTYKIFENHARKVEEEMAAANVKPKIVLTKKCPSCATEIPSDVKNCPICKHIFEKLINNSKICEKCNHENPMNAAKCESCGQKFDNDYKVELKEALRVGVIVRGLDLNEDEIQNYEAYKDDVRDNILKSGDETLLKLIKKLPDESFARLKKILDK
jgi:superfamily II DNA or RNA helicase